MPTLAKKLVIQEENNFNIKIISLSKGDTNMRKTLFITLFTVLLMISQTSLYAQVTLNSSYDVSPYSDLEKTDAKLKVANTNLAVGFMLPYSETTFTLHELSYNRFDLDYRDWNENDGPKIEYLTAVKYNLTIMHMMSEKWSFLGMITPGLASDFKADISSDDFTIEAAAVFIRKYSETYSVGYGVAFSRQFGSPIPIPIIALEWNNGSNLSFNAILPANAELWYQTSEKLQLGFVLGGDGNKYHGDPDIYGGSNPRVDFSVINVGPSLKYKFTDWFSMNMIAGYTAFRLFEFTNEIAGKEVKEEIKADNNAYFKVGFSIGG